MRLPVFLGRVVAMLVVGACLPLANLRAQESGEAVPDTRCVLRIVAPTGATVAIDGRDYGSKREIAFDKLTPGKRYASQLKVRFRNGEEQTRTVLIVGGRRTVVSLPAPQASGPETVPQTGHASYVYSTAVSPNGKYILTGGNDHVAILWDAQSGVQLRRFVGHGGRIDCVAFSRDGEKVLTMAGQPDNSAILWETATGKRLATLASLKREALNSAAFSPDSRQVVTAGPGWERVTLWDAASGAVVRQFTGPREMAVGAVNCAVFSPDGRYILMGGNRYQAAPSKGLLVLWDTATAKVVRMFEGHAGAVGRVAISPDGRYAASSGYLYERPAEVFVWDFRTGQQIQSIAGLASGTCPLAFSPDSKRLFAADGDHLAVIWNVAVGKIERTLAKQSHGQEGPAFSQDGKLLVTGNSSATLIWDAETGELLRSFVAKPLKLEAVAISPDQRQIAIGCNSRVFVWNVPSGQPPRPLVEGNCFASALAFSPDGRTLAVGHHAQLALRDLATGEALHSLAGHAEDCWIKSLAFSPDGQHLLSGGGGLRPGTRPNRRYDAFGEAILWDVVAGRRARSLDVEANQCLHVGFSADGGLAYTGASYGGAATWEVSSGRQVQWLKIDEGWSWSEAVGAFAPRGRQLITGRDQGDLFLWDGGTGQKIRQLIGYSSSTTAACFSKDGQTALTGGRDGTLWFWDVQTGKPLQTMGRHEGTVRLVALTPDGRRAISAGEDSTIRYWDVDSGQEIARLLHLSTADQWLAVTPEGLFDGSEKARQEIRFRVGGRLEVVPVERFFQDFYHPGLLADVAAGRRPMPEVELGKSIAPAVRLVSPERSATVQTQRVKLSIEVTDRGGGIRGPWLTQNGARVLAPGNSSRNGKVLQRSFELPLVTGENRIEVHAASEDGSWESEPASVVLTYEEPQVAPELYMLSVGVNEYAQKTLNLQFAARDAKAIGKLFEGRAPALYGKDKVHVVTLLNEAATKPAIQAAIKGFAAKAKPQDTVLVFLAGHGVTVGQRYFFLTHEFAFERDRLQQDVQDKGLAGDVLGDALAAVPALKRVLIFDTCQSGSTLSVPRTARNAFAFRGALERLSRDQGIFTLAASAATSDAQEVPQLGHGVLTYCLLAALGDVPAGPLEKQPLRPGDERVIGVREWFSYAQDKVPLLTKLYLGHEQFVGFSGQGSNFPVLPLVPR